MKFTLHNYQEKAVAEVLANLKKARARWHRESERSAFSLTAVTGAGKTVMRPQQPIRFLWVLASAALRAASRSAPLASGRVEGWQDATTIEQSYAPRPLRQVRPCLLSWHPANAATQDTE
jgi:hypothetical protein